MKQKISTRASAVLFSFWLFVAYDEGFEYLTPIGWDEKISN